MYQQEMNEIKNQFEDDMMRLMTQGSSDELFEFNAEFRQVKRDSHPMISDEVWQTLRQKRDHENNMGKRAAIVKQMIDRQLVINDTENGRIWKQTFGALERKWAAIYAGSGSGKSNRSKRSNFSKQVCTAFSKMGKVEQERVAAMAERDQFGNLIGNKFDLVADGMICGTIVALIRYAYKGQENVHDKAFAALQKKGFKVIQYREPCESMIHDLQEANQFWIISGIKPLESVYCDAIINAWKKGCGLYLWGDNIPFIGEVNSLLEQLSQEFGSSEQIQLSGNVPGQVPVKFIEVESSPGGFSDHIIFTGIDALNSGETLSVLDKQLIEKLGLKFLLMDHEGNLISAVKETTGQEGRIIIDGGFTRLWEECGFSEGGTSRYVHNCAGYLALLSDEQEQAEVTKLMQTVKLEMEQEPNIVWEGYAGECSITYNTEVLFFLCGEINSDENTGDYTIDNPLGAWKNNMIISPQPIGKRAAEAIVDSGENPFSRQKGCARSSSY